MRQVDRVLSDVNLCVQRRRDVDGCIRDDQRVRVTWHVHDEAVANSPGGSNTRVARHYGSHQFIRVQAALHQRLDTSGGHQFHCLDSGILAMFRPHDLQFGDIETGSHGNISNALLRANQDWLDQVKSGRFDRASERDIVTGMHDGNLDDCFGLCRLDQAFVFIVRNRARPCRKIRHGPPLPSCILQRPSDSSSMLSRFPRQNTV
jgi:hypothetical protein